MRIAQCAIFGLILGIVLPPALFVLYSVQFPAQCPTDVQLILVFGSVIAVFVFALTGFMIGDQWEVSEKLNKWNKK